MVVNKFISKKNGKVSKIISEQFSDLSYSYIQKIIRNKDVKINGKRIANDEYICLGDEIIFFANFNKNNLKSDIFYEDNEILIVFKHRNIEVCDDVTGSNLLDNLIENLGYKIYAVHRLDRNTEGLVIFAKNEKAKVELENALKNNYIQKFYYALVFGKVQPLKNKLIAYLKKDAQKSLVNISLKNNTGYCKIQTNYEVVSSNEEISLLSVELVTGKTHQIRAHLAFIGYPIIGDQKYGNQDVNKIFKLKYQCLCSYKIKFNFPENSFLSYLNQMNFEIKKEKIDFCQKM